MSKPKVTFATTMPLRCSSDNGLGPNGHYEGEYVLVEDTVYPNGEGECTSLDGKDVYKGSWNHNKFTHGTHEVKGDGLSYLGNFKDGKYNGDGVLAKKGLVFTGTFEEGNLEGEGTLVDTREKPPIVYKGKWSTDQKTGQATCAVEGNPNCNTITVTNIGNLKFEKGEKNVVTQKVRESFRASGSGKYPPELDSNSVFADTIPTKTSEQSSKIKIDDTVSAAPTATTISLQDVRKTKLSQTNNGPQV